MLTKSILKERKVCQVCSGCGFDDNGIVMKTKEAIQKARILLGSLGHGSEDEARLASKIDEILREASK